MIPAPHEVLAGPDPEPPGFVDGVDADELKHAITYMGRISLSKGADAIVYLANALEDLQPLERLLLIGNEVATPFKVVKMQDYLRGRLSPALRERVQFTGYLPRAQALGLLQAGEIAPHIRAWDEAATYDPRVGRQLGELGLLGIFVPRRYGGSGLDYIPLGIASEELEYVDTFLRVFLSVPRG